jgi:hypothetical protein
MIQTWTVAMQNERLKFKHADSITRKILQIPCKMKGSIFQIPQMSCKMIGAISTMQVDVAVADF